MFINLKCKQTHSLSVDVINILGPTLFLLFINDLADGFANLNCAVKLYADDAKLYSSYSTGDFPGQLLFKHWSI